MFHFELILGNILDDDDAVLHSCQTTLRDTHCIYRIGCLIMSLVACLENVNASGQICDVDVDVDDQLASLIFEIYIMKKYKRRF